MNNRVTVIVKQVIKPPKMKTGIILEKLRLLISKNEVSADPTNKAIAIVNDMHKNDKTTNNKICKNKDRFFKFHTPL